MAFTEFLAFEGIAGNVDRNGVQTINVAYFVETLEQARRWIPEQLVADIGIPVTRRTFQQEWGNAKLLNAGAKDGAYKVTLTLEGVENPTDTEQGVQFDADGDVDEQRIESHPDFSFLKEKYGGTINEEKGEVVWPETIAISGETLPNPLFGAKDFLVPGVIWTKTYCTLRPSATVTQRLGKIDQPPRSPDGYLPDLPGRRNWVKIVGKPTWRGNIWKVVEAWRMSAEGGANEDVYR